MPKRQPRKVLTPQQQVFVNEYLAGKPAVEAYRAAYGEGNGNYSTLTKKASNMLNGKRAVGVRKAIAAAKRKAEDRFGITAERTLAELARVAYARTHRLIKIDSNGQAYIDWRDLDPDDAAQLSGITITEKTSGIGDAKVTTRTTKFSSHDKNAALALMMRHQGLLKDAESGDRPITIVINGTDAKL